MWDSMSWRSPRHFPPCWHEGSNQGPASSWKKLFFFYFNEAEKRLAASKQTQLCPDWISAPMCALARSPCIQPIPLTKTTEVPFNETFSSPGKWFQNVEQGLMQVSWKLKPQTKKFFFPIWKNILLLPTLTLMNENLPPKCYFLEC